MHERHADSFDHARTTQQRFSPGYPRYGRFSSYMYSQPIYIWCKAKKVVGLEPIGIPGTPRNLLDVCSMLNSDPFSNNGAVIWDCWRHMGGALHHVSRRYLRTQVHRRRASAELARCVRRWRYLEFSNIRGSPRVRQSGQILMHVDYKKTGKNIYSYHSRSTYPKLLTV